MQRRRFFSLALIAVAIATAFVVLRPHVANADESLYAGTWGTCPWEIGADGVLTIHPGQGASQDGATASPWEEYSSEITSIVIVKEDGQCVVAPENSSYLFAGLHKATSFSAEGFDVSSVTSMRNMFMDGSFHSLDLRDWDVSSVEDMNGMFSNCIGYQDYDSTFIDISGWNASSVTDMHGMFQGNSWLRSIDASNMDASSAIDLSRMFRNNEILLSVSLSGWDISSAQDLSEMFMGCSQLQSLELPGSLSARDLHGLVEDCRSLSTFTSYGWDTSRVTTMALVFDDCASLRELDLSCWTVPSVTTYQGMFSRCSSLESLDLSGWTVQNVDQAKFMFSECSSLRTIVVTDQYWTDKIVGDEKMFVLCKSLVGGNGTSYDNYRVETCEAACVDTTEHKGYFTASTRTALDDATISEISPQAYSGSSVEPEYAVILDGTALVEGVDYVTYYHDNKGPGTACVTVQGIGNYVGILKTSFQILSVDISACVASFNTDVFNEDGLPVFTYTGGTIEPEVVLTLDGTTLVRGKDYTVAFENNVNCGSSPAEMTVTGIGGYSGNKVFSFVIAPASIESCSATLSSTSYVYTGEEICPQVTLTTPDYELVSGRDFVCEYRDNTEIGTAYADVTGVGNYTGTISLPFQITLDPAALVVIVPEEIPDQTYSGYDIEPPVTLLADGDPLSMGSDFTVRYENNRDAGKAKAIVSFIGTYYGKEPIEVPFVILPASMDSCSAAFDSDEYSDIDGEVLPVYHIPYGEDVRPEVSFTLDDYTMVPDHDYLLTYGPVDENEVCSITAVGTGNFNGEVVVRVIVYVSHEDIALADIEISDPDPEYTGQAIEPDVVVTFEGETLQRDVDYEVAYSNNVNVGYATITISGIGRFSGSTEVAFEIHEPVIPFTDVSEKTPHSSDILWLAESGISTGWAMADGTRQFRPMNTVIRQDMAAFLFREARLWGLVDDSWQPTGKVTFTDVTPKTPHYREIMWLAESGVSSGWTMKDGTKQFRPTNTVIRQDMAAFLRRMQALRDPSVGSWAPTAGSPFADVNARTPHYEDVLWLAESGVSTGWSMPGGTRQFRPTNTVVRQDMAAFLQRLNALG